jgi:hypothetical protein
MPDLVQQKQPDSMEVAKSVIKVPFQAAPA